MYNLLIFLHVTSALLLGTYVIFPFLANRLTTLSGQALKSSVDLLLGFTRIGHYALIVLLLTGVGMISQFGTKPSVLWIASAVVLLVIIGTVIGMMNKWLKQLIATSKAENSTVELVGRIRTYSWIAASAVIAAILIMTNPSLLS